MIGKNRKKNDVSAQGLSSCKIGGDSLPCCAILESMTDGVFTVDLERRINTFFNRAAEEITGFTFAEAVNQFCFDILRSSTCQTNCPLERTLKTGEPVYNHPAVIISRTGKEIPISVTTALIRDSRGEITGAVEIFRDLSALEALRKTIAGGVPPRRHDQQESADAGDLRDPAGHRRERQPSVDPGTQRLRQGASRPGRS